MRLGIAIEETWDFFNEIYADLAKHYRTSLFKRRTFRPPIFSARINRYAFHHDLQAFMQANDIVFFEWASELLAVATHLKKTCGIVARLHRYEMYAWAHKINWEAVDRIILVSRAKQDEFIANFPSQAAKTMVCSPSISLDKFKFEPKKFNGDIGILCHLTPRKRVYDLILAFYELTCQRTGLHLHIAGGCHSAHRDYCKSLHDIVEELDLHDKVSFYDHVTDTRNWYHKIDIFVSNSYSEGLQVAPMEAMASGCYCLAHRWKGATELLPEDNLFYTSRELQEKILCYCDASESEHQSQLGRMRTIACEKFDINMTTAQIRAVIEEVSAHTPRLKIKA